MRNKKLEMNDDPGKGRLKLGQTRPRLKTGITDMITESSRCLYLASYQTCGVDSVEGSTGLTSSSPPWIGFD